MKKHNFLIRKETVMDNELMNQETELELVEVSDDKSTSGMGSGLAMLIGSGLTLAAVAGVGFARKKWRKHKAKKEAEEFDDIFDEEVDFREEEVSKETEDDKE